MLSDPTKPMKHLLTLLALLPLAAPPAQAQDAGQVGITFDAQLAPQVGLAWQVTDILALRASAYVEGGGDEVLDLNERFIGSVALLFSFSPDEELSTYVGPDYTRNNFASENYLGGIFGARYQIHDRFGVFGEVGLSIDVGDSIETVSMFNTGAGVVFYLNE